VTTLRLLPERTVLLVVDVQERLAAAMPGSGEPCAKNVDRLLEGARLLALPVLVTEQYPKGLGPSVAPIRDRLATFSPPVTALEKIEFDATRNAGVAAALETLRAAGRTHAVVCGMEAHICVYQTARGLVDAGWHVHVASDACASRVPANAEIALSLWEKSGAVPTVTETVLFDLLSKAGGDAFKAVSQLVR
jgi:nicotinamidase-related amidase